MPLFLVERIPKEDPLRHSGDTSHAMPVQDAGYHFTGYIIVLILSRIHSFPYMQNFSFYIVSIGEECIGERMYRGKNQDYNITEERTSNILHRHDRGGIPRVS